MGVKKPWSISTTIRNPDRVRGLLEVARGFEGKKFDEAQQIAFQISLIQKKLYRPTKMTQKLSSYYDKPEDMSQKQAKEVFEHMCQHSDTLKNDPGIRGRTSIAPLGKMGLVVSKTRLGQLRITDFGKRFLSDQMDMAEIFLEYFFKWPLPNPYSTQFSKKDGFDIRPFIATIRIIDQVNKEWAQLGHKAKGLTKEEFYVFVPTTIDYREIPDTVSEIINLRKKLLGKNKQEEKEIKENVFADKINNFFGDDGKNYTKNRSNLRDYGDNAIRYFKITRFFYIRGGGFCIDLEPRRKVEVEALLRSSSGESISFVDLDAYLAYMERAPSYPWETKEKLVKISELLLRDVNELDKEWKMPLASSQSKLLSVSTQTLSVSELKQLVKDLRDLRTRFQEYKNRILLLEDDRFEEVIMELSQIYSDKGDRASKLEYLVTMSLHGINDAIKIKPNYPVGDDNLPTFTAPAGLPDIECYYKTFNMVCEVTMLVGRDQWINEGQPVMRHLRDFEEKNPNSVCLFICPRIHRDAFNTFSMANKFGYEGKKQKIVPLSISLFLKLLNAVLKKRKEGKPLTHAEFKILLEELYGHMVKADNLNIWAEKSGEILNQYGEGN